VVEAKYGSVRGGWRSRDNAGSHGVGLWRFISRDWHRFSSHTKLIPGDGSRIGRSCGVVIQLLRRLSRGCIT
jgi:hypothetical protein